MTDEEKKAIETLKEVASDNFDTLGDDISPKMAQNILNVLDKQQKEIEVLREENFDTIYMKAIADYKSKIKEILQIEGNADIETYLKTIVAENNRLEDIEDDRDCNYVSKDKIRENIKELEGQEDWYIENKSLDDLYGRIDELKQLLEE